MWNVHLISSLILLSILVIYSNAANDVLGCGGFVKSHAPIDFSKIEVKLYTRQGNLKDNAFCAPNNGYYFVPLYDKGDYILKINPPPGWSFKPQQVELTIDGFSDVCSKGGDINFIFEGFGITGNVDNIGGSPGPAGVTVKLIDGSVTTETKTTEGGNFYFTPVFPGKYTLVASHPRWQIKKNTVEVQVATGNTEVPKNSLLVAGYDVHGTVIFENKPLAKVNFILFNELNTPVYIDGCSTKELLSFTSPEKKLCHAISNDDGVFRFPALSPGKYRVVAFFEEENVKYHMVPNEMIFNVTTNSVELKPTFTATSFTVKGHVFTNVDGKSVPGATIILNDKQITVTKNDGSFLLENLIAGTYNLLIEAPGLKFEMEILKISTNVMIKSEFYPSAFQVCGNVASELSHEIMFTIIESKIKPKITHYTTSTEQGTGDFCYFLPPGKYSATVKVSSKEKSKGIQFFPVEQVFNLSDHPQMGLFFSQLKATVSGTVTCLRPSDCTVLKIVLKMQTDHTDTEEVKYLVPLNENSTYRIPNVIPGTYTVSLEENKYCWKQDHHVITLNSEKTIVPDFVQEGYIIRFKATHDTQLDYPTKDPKAKVRVQSVLIVPGNNKICVEKAGTYDFTPISCHLYDTNHLSFDTDGNAQELVLTPIKHEVTFDIKSELALQDMKVNIKVGETSTVQGPIRYMAIDKTYYYKVSVHLAENEEATINPQAESLWFKPNSLKIRGANDCVDLGTRIIGVKGKVIQGKISPTLENVDVKVTRSDGEVILAQTDKYGKYKFPTMDASFRYEISASKDSYFFTGPDDKGIFIAHKLAEIIVKVVDKSDGKSLQGALISLSGAESYRSNLQTDNDGLIRFTSLSPSDYFLRPMMKEYNFDPPSKMISVKEGATVNVKLSGNRVAYSAYGIVNSLSGEPEADIIVSATGIGNCAQYSEEATSEANGHFRIRGLQPNCGYEISVKDSSETGTKIEKSLPEFVQIQVNKQDVQGIKLIVIHQVPNMDIIAYVTSPDPENFKNLRVKVFRESVPNSPIYNVKLDSTLYKTQKPNNPGVLVHLPPLPLDNKIYFIRLDSITSQNSQGYSTEPQFFQTNTSFKYFNLDYNPNSNSHEHQIGQTSILTLPFMALCIVAFYNIDKLSKFFIDIFNRFDVHNVRGIFQRVTALPTERPLNEDIDELVQNINAPKRKLKVRKT